MHQQDQIARIQRMQEETRKFVAAHRTIDRVQPLRVWPFAFGGMLAGAACFGAGAAFTMIFGV